ncbi:hypothetical protein [Cellulomonas endophytica]|uniref:hypothetical protein n=1 Tax=Cellulomonas endophytica TaxID=2494735 RepID=UPI001013667F|nr:hypothetical protein [Cellulomonas endophytica]
MDGTTRGTGPDGAVPEDRRGGPGGDGPGAGQDDGQGAVRGDEPGAGYGDEPGGAPSGDGRDDGPVEGEELVRLRAADPARGTPVPEAAVRERVADRTGVPLAGTSPAAATSGPDDPTSAGTDPHGVVPLAPRRRRRVWLPAAAAVAGALVVGGGGYGIGVAQGGDGGTVITAAPALTLGDASAAGGQDAAAGSAAQVAPAGPATGGAAPERLAVAGADAAMMPWGGGRTVFTGSGLGDATGSAPAWAYDASGVVDAATAERVAAALGVTGTATAQYGTWMVGPTDGSGPNVMVWDGGSVGFNRPVDEGCLDPAAAGGEACPASDPDASAQALRDAMRAVGLDPDGWAVTATSDGTGVTVQAFRVVEGRQVGDPWSAWAVGGELVNLSGSLAALAPLGDYPTIGAQEGVERLNDPRFGSGGPVWAADAGVAQEGAGAGDAATSSVVGPDETTPPSAAPVPEAGAPVPWSVRTVDLTSAELTWATTWTPDGGALLLPTWAYTDADGATWTVLAVAESALDLG